MTSTNPPSSAVKPTALIAKLSEIGTLTIPLISQLSSFLGEVADALSVKSTLAANSLVSGLLVMILSVPD